MTRKLSPAERGKLGGKATFQKYGREHMSKIGQIGALVLHDRYKLVPIDLNKFALVNRITEEIVAIRES